MWSRQRPARASRPGGICCAATPAVISKLASASAGSTGRCPVVCACSGRKNCPSGKSGASRCAAWTARLVLPMPAIPSMARIRACGRPPRLISQQPRQLGLAAGEAADVTRQRPRRRGRRRPRVRSGGNSACRPGALSWKICSGRPRSFSWCTPRSISVAPGGSASRTRAAAVSDTRTWPPCADRRHPRSAMHIQAHRAHGRVRRLTGVHAHPHPDALPGRPRMTLQGLLHLHHRRHARPRRRERGEEPVPERVQLPATVRGQNRPDQRVMIGQQPRVHAFTHPPQQRRGALDIGKQKRNDPRSHQLPGLALAAGDGGHIPRQRPADRCRSTRPGRSRNSRQHLGRRRAAPRGRPRTARAPGRPGPAPRPAAARCPCGRWH